MGNRILIAFMAFTCVTTARAEIIPSSQPAKPDPVAPNAPDKLPRDFMQERPAQPGPAQAEAPPPGLFPPISSPNLLTESDTTRTGPFVHTSPESNPVAVATIPGGWEKSGPVVNGFERDKEEEEFYETAEKVFIAVIGVIAAVLLIGCVCSRRGRFA
jgi:hypothetical protein